jgi:hypothetical protein
MLGREYKLHTTPALFMLTQISLDTANSDFNTVLAVFDTPVPYARDPVACNGENAKT